MPIKLLKNFTTLQICAGITKPHSKYPLHIFQESQAHNYLFLKLAVSLSSSPAQGLFIGANCLTHCAKTFIQIQNKKDPLKDFNGPENIISKSAYLRLRNIIAMSAATPANAATSAGSGTCANPTCRLYPLPIDSTHLNTAYASSTPIP